MNNGGFCAGNGGYGWQNGRRRAVSYTHLDVDKRQVHGLAEKDGFGNLYVDFCREEDRMCVCVRDDGVGMEEQTVRALIGQDGAPSANGRESVGLRNVR